MRTPLYKSRPVAPFSARFGGHRFNEFVVMSEGNSNSYLLQTRDGDILVNAGMGYEAPVHHKNFSEFSSAPIKYLVTTQGHVDHVGGVQFFRDRNPGLQYIAQAGNPEHQQYDARLQAFRASRSAFRFMEAFKRDFAYYAQQGYTDINPQDVPVPDVMFETHHGFSLGGLDVELIAVKGAETNDSLIVWLPQHGICLTGNLFGCPFGHFPNLVTIRGDRYRDALSCAEAAQTVLDLGPQVILYGHHEPIVGRELIETEVTAIRDAIRYVHDATVAGMNAGTDVHSLMQEIELPASLEVGQGYGKVSWGVRAIWENYAGWFHHQSTAELYSVPQSSIHADLVDMLGASALVDRARQNMDLGGLEQALHLLDIVFSVDGENPDAIALAIDIHQKLLRQSENFWLSGWLENQIKLLKGGETAALSFS